MPRRQATQPPSAQSKKTRHATGSGGGRKRTKRGVGLTPLTPVPEKIGEGPGNLKARAAAFKRRRGGS